MAKKKRPNINIIWTDYIVTIEKRSYSERGIQQFNFPTKVSLVSTVCVLEDEAKKLPPEVWKEKSRVQRDRAIDDLLNKVKKVVEENEEMFRVESSAENPWMKGGT